ncbi:MAG: glycosyltransferase, partial [Candidatus Peribacteraceae bacterium]|nr:glycosyltransferase [Candidatus Peribacteraceae bacterium]
MFRFWNQIIDPLLEILSPQEILEIGGGTGRMPRKLAEYARMAGGRLTFIDPLPFFDSAALERTWKDVLTVHRAWSTDIVPTCQPPDFVLIDGDHNWYTVYHELLAIEALAEQSGQFPVVLLHDVGWPYARRDSYVLPGRIPQEYRQPFAIGGVLPNTDRLISDGGLNERMSHALENGGPHNGVRTALEDFLKQTSLALSATMVEGFHGLMIIVPEQQKAASESLQKFLVSLPVSDAVEAHIALLEHERIQDVLIAKDIRFSVQTTLSQRDSYRRAMTQLSAESSMKDHTLVRWEKTLSWRITSPIRRLGMLKKVLTLNRSWFGVLKNVWTALGQPLPGFVRWVRHRLLENIFSVPDSQQQTDVKQADRIQNRYGGAVPVSVIVTARNNSEFLRECLQSIAAQTVKPMEVIYCDDGSDDNSVKIASSMPGIRILPLPHQGVVAARNEAVKESKGDLLLHIDGDDMIPPDYLAQHLRALALSNGAAFAFGGSNMFGLQSSTSQSDWSVQKLWTQNFINTSSLIRRSAFEAAGGWRDIAGTLWDWDLWLRMSRIGPGVSSDTFLLYRRHERNWSQLKRQLTVDEIGLLYGRIRRAAAQVSVCAIVSGRLPELMDTWIDALVLSIKASESAANPPELIILDNSKNGMEQRIKKALEKHPDVFRSVMV